MGARRKRRKPRVDAAPPPDAGGGREGEAVPARVDRDGGAERGKNVFAAVLASPLALLACIVAGLSVARLYPAALPYLRPFGEGYGALLRMTVVPFAVASITSSLLGVLRRRDPRGMVRRAVVCSVVLFGAMLLYGAAVTVAVEARKKPSVETREKIGRLMFERAKPGETADDWAVFEVEAETSTPRDSRPAWLRTLLASIPENVFRALAAGDMAQIVLFFVLFSLTARFLPEGGYVFLQSFFDGAFSAVSRVMGWVYLFAAPGMGCLLAVSFKPLDPDTLWSLRDFILLLAGSFAAWTAAFLLFLWRRSGRSFRECLATLSGPLLMAAAAGKGVAMPKVVDGLNALGFDPGTAKALTPASLGLNPAGKAMLFALAAGYCCHLYGVPMNTENVAVLLVTVPVAALSAVQVVPLVWYGYLAIPMASLGAPIGPVLILLYTLDMAMYKLLMVMEVGLAAALVAYVSPRPLPVAGDVGEREKGEAVPPPSSP